MSESTVLAESTILGMSGSSPFANHNNVGYPLTAYLSYTQSPSLPISYTDVLIMVCIDFCDHDSIKRDRCKLLLHFIRPS